MPRSFILAWRASANKRSEGRGRPPSSSSFWGWLVLEVEREREALLYYSYFPFSSFLTNGSDASFDAERLHSSSLLIWGEEEDSHGTGKSSLPLSLVWQANLASASPTKRNYSVNLKRFFPWAKRCCFIMFFFFSSHHTFSFFFFFGVENTFRWPFSSATEKGALLFSQRKCRKRLSFLLLSSLCFPLFLFLYPPTPLLQEEEKRFNGGGGNSTSFFLGTSTFWWKLLQKHKFSFCKK